MGTDPNFRILSAVRLPKILSFAVAFKCDFLVSLSLRTCLEEPLPGPGSHLHAPFSSGSWSSQILFCLSGPIQLPRALLVSPLLVSSSPRFPAPQYPATRLSNSWKRKAEFSSPIHASLHFTILSLVFWWPQELSTTFKQMIFVFRSYFVISFVRILSSRKSLLNSITAGSRSDRVGGVLSPETSHSFVPISNPLPFIQYHCSTWSFNIPQY